MLLNTALMDIKNVLLLSILTIFYYKNDNGIFQLALIINKGTQFFKIIIIYVPFTKCKNTLIPFLFHVLSYKSTRLKKKNEKKNKTCTHKCAYNIYIYICIYVQFFSWACFIKLY